MAQGKKSFLLYTDVIGTVSLLTDEQAGKLFKHILAYVNDQDPKIDDVLVQVAFEPIKQNLKRALKDREQVVEKRKVAGKLGGLAKASNAKKIVANLAVNENDNVNVNDNVKERGKKYISSRGGYNLFEGSSVKITKEVLDSIAGEYGETVVSEYLEKVDLYCGSNGKVYKDYGMTIRNWLSRDKMKKIAQRTKSMNASDLKDKKERETKELEKELADRKKPLAGK